MKGSVLRTSGREKVSESSATRALASSFVRVVRLSVCLACVLAVQLSARAAVPEGFTETLVTGGLASPTAMAFAPDGRLFVCLQGGQVRVIKGGALLPTPFVTLNVDQRGERGLLGITFDPDFASNNFVYVYYTVNSDPRHNRVSRFTAAGDVAAPGSETLVFRLDDLSLAQSHNGGALHFGPDGKLYVAVGENNLPDNAQTLSNLHGKMLRINRDGTVPADNPFSAQAAGNKRAIWALGLRNPFTFAFQPGSGRMFINDVGAGAFEEINDGVAGANYGWPLSEGPTSNPAHRGPVFSYGHGNGPTVGCAITGGLFYNPPAPQFPSGFVGKYFFADFCGGWIRVLDPSNNTASDFAADVSLPVDLRVGPDGSLFYLSRGAGGVFNIRFAANQPPGIITHPTSQTIPVGKPVTFTVAASGVGPHSYQWRRDGADIPGANSPSFHIPAVSLSDDGAKFRCVVSNAFGSTTTNEAVLTVTPNREPTATITAPAAGALYRAGETIAYAGAGSDPEDGALPASAFTWRVDFHHDEHTHPFVFEVTGQTGGSFDIPAVGETSSNVWYRIHLTVRDSGGLAHSTFRDVLPRKSNFTLLTDPPGLQLTLDGQPVTTPLTVTGVVGLRRTLGVVSPQSVNGSGFEFSAWSDGGAASHEITTPEADSTFTASFAPVANPPTLHFDRAAYRFAENARQVLLTVKRDGNAAGTATVDYATVDGTATERTDFITTLGTLHFASGETEKTVTLLVTDDTYLHGDKTLTVKLSNPTGGTALVEPSTAAVTIEEDEAGPQNRNLIDDPRFFVRQHYHDFLNRDPDEDGLNFWAAKIERCGADARCVEVERVNVSAAFFFSIEFQGTGFLVYRLYRLGFGRLPRYREFVRDTQEMSRGVVVGVGDWQERLAANQRAFLERFVERAEFEARYPAGQAADVYVDSLNANGGGALAEAERDALVVGLLGGVETRATALHRVADDRDYVRAETNGAFVLMEYFGYLRRSPDDPPNNSMAGYFFWLDKLESFGGDFHAAEMVKAFITSFEYRDRFGP
jgi:glucose/arabinose dehydrogenase